MSGSLRGASGPGWGLAIDRTRPISFRLNGQDYRGFAGDSVLSAVLGAGTDTFGLRFGEPMALTRRFAPPVALAGGNEALPMDRLTIEEGMDLTSVGFGPRPLSLAERARRLLGQRSRSLDLAIDAVPALPGPWTGQTPSLERAADLVIVGAGLAGLTAAKVAREAGLGVVIIEREPVPGGISGLFAPIDSREKTGDEIAALVDLLTADGGAELMLSADALRITDGRVIVHRIEEGLDGPQNLVSAIAARHVVLATGARERLPVFAGNRLPGLVAGSALYLDARAYDVWPGERLMFSMGGNAGYKLAVLAQEAGRTITRTLDCRPQPRSRFIDFAKASGMPYSSGLLPHAAMLDPKGQVGVTLAVALADADRPQLTEMHLADALVLCAGWQPELDLWLSGGGTARLDTTQGLILAGDGPAELVLAGSAAGTRTAEDTRQSARQVVDRLLGRGTGDRLVSIEDTDLESPDAGLCLAPPARASKTMPAFTAYFDDGHSMAARRGARQGGLLGGLLPGRDAGQDQAVLDEPRALALGDLAPKILTGELPEAYLPALVAERMAVSRQLVPAVGSEPETPSHAAPTLPAWLCARFGATPRLWRFATEDGRSLEVGNLLFAQSEAAAGAGAIGVVVRQPSSAFADHDVAVLLGDGQAVAGAPVWVHSGSGPVRVTLEGTPQDADFGQRRV